MPCVLCLSFQQKFNVSTGTIVIPIMDEFQEKSKKFSCKHSHYQRPPTSWFHIVEWQICDNGSTVLLDQPHYQTTNASHRWLSPIAILCAWSFSYSIGCFVICGVSQFVCNASSQCNAMRTAHHHTRALQCTLCSMNTVSQINTAFGKVTAPLP